MEKISDPPISMRLLLPQLLDHSIVLIIISYPLKIPPSAFPDYATIYYGIRR
jgi:hypothetical protein